MAISVIRKSLKDHFIFPTHQTGNFKAKCIHCHKHYAASERSYTNLSKHFDIKHSGIRLQQVTPTPTPKIEEAFSFGKKWSSERSI